MMPCFWAILGLIAALFCASVLSPPTDDFGSGVSSFSIPFVAIGSLENLADTTSVSEPADSVPCSCHMASKTPERTIDAANAVGGLNAFQSGSVDVGAGRGFVGGTVTIGDYKILNNKSRRIVTPAAAAKSPRRRSRTFIRRLPPEVRQEKQIGCRSGSVIGGLHVFPEIHRKAVFFEVARLRRLSEPHEIGYPAPLHSEQGAPLGSARRHIFPVHGASLGALRRGYLCAIRCHLGLEHLLAWAFIVVVAPH